MKLNLQKAGVVFLSACMLITEPLYALSINPQPIEAAVTESTGSTQPVVVEEIPVKMEDAMKEFKSLPKQERKARISEAKKELKEYKKNKRENKNDGGTSTLLEVIIAIFIPPLAVYLHEEEINSKFWIDLLLTLLFYIPGLIYALVVILSK